MASKPTVALTGGIACGKSTVAQRLAELGVPIVDADRLARDVVAPGTPGLADVVATFGDGVLLPDGSLDRKALGSIVFADRARRAALEAITHPRIAAESARRMSELAATDAPYLVYEAALVVENGIHGAFDALVVVAVSPDVQLARLMARDGIGRSAAEERIAAQLPLERKIDLADFVIRNDGTREQTRARVDEVHAELLSRFGGGRR